MPRKSPPKPRKTRSDAKPIKEVTIPAARARAGTVIAPLSAIENSALRGKTIVFTNKNQIETLSPGQVAHLRGRLGSMVREHLELANLVVRGELEWSPTQARIFATLINKVVPDLSASFHAHEHKHQGVREMSRADLERIARGLDDLQTIEAEHELLNPAPETALNADQEPPEGSPPVDPDA